MTGNVLESILDTFKELICRPAGLCKTPLCPVSGPLSGMSRKLATRRIAQ